jgi:hypothetical protein
LLTRAGIIVAMVVRGIGVIYALAGIFVPVLPGLAFLVVIIVYRP